MSRARPIGQRGSRDAYDKGLAELEKQAQTMIDDLLWWTAALKAARKP
jgi:hypothetical protein